MLIKNNSKLIIKQIIMLIINIIVKIMVKQNNGKNKMIIRK